MSKQFELQMVFTCDKCGQVRQACFSATMAGLYSITLVAADLAQAAARAGWSIGDNDTLLLCPNCKKAGE